MIELDRSQLGSTPVELEEESLFRGPSTQRLDDRLEFGGPIARVLTPSDANDDADLAAFIAREWEAARYAQVHCAISFNAGDTPLASAAVELQLASPSSEPPPIAWSLSPEVAATPFELTTSFSVGPKLKILGAEAGAEIGESKTAHGEDAFLRSTGLLTGRPSWVFARRKTVELEGSYRLILIIRTPAGAPLEVTVTLRASLAHRGVPQLFRKTLPPDSWTSPSQVILGG